MLHERVRRGRLGPLPSLSGLPGPAGAWSPICRTQLLFLASTFAGKKRGGMAQWCFARLPLSQKAFSNGMEMVFSKNLWTSGAEEVINSAASPALERRAPGRGGRGPPRAVWSRSLGASCCTVCCSDVPCVRVAIACFICSNFWSSLSHSNNRCCESWVGCPHGHTRLLV